MFDPQYRIFMQIIGICCLIVHLLSGSARAQRAVTVSMVVDGDRIVLSDGRKIALLGVDAPEKHRSNKLTMDALENGRSEEEVIRQGELAAAYLNKIAGGYPVLVRPLQLQEVEKASPAYVPALVYVVDPLGDILYSLNQQMMLAGFARVDRTYEAKETRLYVELEKKARRERLGIWADTDRIMPPGEGEVLDERPDMHVGACARNRACIWVSISELPGGSGIWRSRPGRVCPCAPK